MSEQRVRYEDLQQRVAFLEKELDFLRRNPTETRCGSGRAGAKSTDHDDRFRSLVECISDWIWEIDAEGVYTYASPKVMDLLGYEPGEIVGKRPFDLMPEDEADRIAALILPIMKAAQPFSAIENLNVRKDGRLVLLETSGVPILSPHGRLIGYRGIDRDITLRKRSEEQLGLALKRLRLHVENTPMAVVEWGPDFRISHWNAEAERMFGWQAEEVIGKRIEDLRWVYEEDVVKVKEVSAGLYTGTKTRSFSVNRNYRKDGTVIHCEWYNSSLLDSEGNLISILALVQDVTSREQTEEALRESEQRLLLAVRTAGIAIWDWDVVRDTVHWHNAWHGLIADPPEKEHAYEWWAGKIHPDDRDAVLSDFGRALTCREDTHVAEYRFRLLDGTWANLHDRSVILRDSEGCAVRVVGAVMDVTAQRRTEKELQRAHGELERRVEERTAQLSGTVDVLQDEVIQRMVVEQSLRQTSEQLRRLAADLSLAEKRERERLSQILHDGLQQFLVAAKFRLALMSMAFDDERILVSVGEVDSLIEKSIEMARSLSAELNPPALRAGVIPALEWLSGWMEETHGLITDFTADKTIEQPSESVILFLFHATRELLLNIVKHSGVKAARVHLSQAEGAIQLVVADEGGGFDPSGLRMEGGCMSGTGLFGIRERLHMLGGKMAIRSSPGRGAEFTLVIPPAASSAD